jgi:methyl-accepting chemotaxis protein
MSEAHLPSGTSFARRMSGLSCALAVPVTALMLGLLVALLELTGEQWRWFFTTMAICAALACFPLRHLQRRMLAPVRRYLDHRSRDGMTREERHAAFAALLDLPRRVALLGSGGWAVPVILVSAVMRLRFPQHWGFFEAGVLVLAGLAAAFVHASFALFLVKRSAGPVREALTAELPEPSERRALIRPLRLRSKLLVCTTGVTIVPVIFAVVLSDASVKRSLEEFAIGWQHRVLDAVAVGLDREDVEATRGAVLEVDPALPASLRVALLEPDRVPADLGLEPHVVEHLRSQLQSGSQRGDTRSLPSRRVFSWLRLDDGRLLLAMTPEDELRPDVSGLWDVFGLLLAASTAVALCLSWLLSGDVGQATQALRSEAERLASGDLRRGRVYESEDELGDLSRGFESMAASLRATVGRVAKAADRVEGTAGEVASVTESVSTVTAEQVQGILRATTSMDAINQQVKGIADSSQALNVSVEESSSSILELGASGEELKETASVLSSRVDEVSASIEQMVRSVRQVSENSEALSEASVETSSSMEEMASAMRQVDTSAEETAQLSRQVVESAEAGQEKVRQTIEGMEAIREATETAERVIRSLGERTTEIGAIVDVIDDVADETNLLALNAAIIAAQAGEQGRAFSVVAEEIKELADRVLASTKEIGSLIRSVQDEASNAIGAIECGAQSVASGVDLSAEAGVGLEAITRASRESGTRIAAIVVAVREQAKATGHVVELMDRVRAGVDRIQAAAAEQGRGNEVVHRSSVAMRDVAQQVRGTTEEQARGSRRIRESIEEVRDTVEQINVALQEQSAACRSAAEFLEVVYQRTRANEESGQRLEYATRNLLGQAEALRRAMQRFQI